MTNVVALPPPVRRVTRERVFQACELLIAQGERVSVRKVRMALGGGSPNAITAHVAAFHHADPAQRAAVEAAADPLTAVRSELHALTTTVESLVGALAVLMRQLEARPAAANERAPSDLVVDVRQALTTLERKVDGLASRPSAPPAPPPAAPTTRELDAIREELATVLTQQRTDAEAAAQRDRDLRAIIASATTAPPALDGIRSALEALGADLASRADGLATNVHRELKALRALVVPPQRATAPRRRRPRPATPKRAAVVRRDARRDPQPLDLVGSRRVRGRTTHYVTYSRRGVAGTTRISLARWRAECAGMARGARPPRSVPDRRAMTDRPSRGAAGKGTRRRSRGRAR